MNPTYYLALLKKQQDDEEAAGRILDALLGATIKRADAALDRIREYRARTLEPHA